MEDNLEGKKRMKGEEMCLRINPIETQKFITMDEVEEYNDFFKINY